MLRQDTSRHLRRRRDFLQRRQDKAGNYVQKSRMGDAVQSVITLEPVYELGGGLPEWVDWFFRMFTDQPHLGYNYVQEGPSLFRLSPEKGRIVIQNINQQRGRPRKVALLHELANKV